MPDYVDHFEEVLNRLEAIRSNVSEEFQFAILPASFGDNNASPYRQVFASLKMTEIEPT